MTETNDKPLFALEYIHSEYNAVYTTDTDGVFDRRPIDGQEFDRLATENTARFLRTVRYDGGHFFNLYEVQQ